MEQGPPPSAALQLRALGGVECRAHGVFERVVGGRTTLVDGGGAAGAVAAVQLPAAGEAHGVIANHHKAAAGIASQVPALGKRQKGTRGMGGGSGVERSGDSRSGAPAMPAVERERQRNPLDTPLDTGWPDRNMR